MIRSKSTHRAHCQVCGHIQAVVVGNRMAKHGYTVKGWGFFMGTCGGSDKKPLQLDRVVTDGIIKRMLQLVAFKLERKAALEAGTVLPEMAKTGKRIRDVASRWIDEECPYAEAAPYYQQDAVRREVWSAENDARHAQDHADFLTKLATQVHGTALLPIVVVERVAPVAPKVDVKAGTVSGVYATKAARQADLDKLGREYEAARKVLQDMYLKGGESIRNNQEATDFYYGVGSLAHWRPRHSALALHLYPQAAEVVKQIEALVKAREAVKNA